MRRIRKHINFFFLSSNGCLIELAKFAVLPLMPSSDQSFLFVDAPSDTTPSTLAPTFSKRHMALMTNCARTMLVIIALVISRNHFNLTSINYYKIQN